MSGSALPAITASGRDKLEARLQALCHNNGVTETLMDTMGDNGLTTVNLLKNTFADKNEWRTALKDAPFNLSGTDFATKLQIGKLVGVYEACVATAEVEVKANAERIRQNLPPEINVQEILNSQKIFEQAHFELTRAMLPSKGYFERMALQVEAGFEEAPLTTVTNLTQDDVNDNPNELKMNMMTGQSTRSQKQYLIPLPKRPEELRARFRTLAICWVFLKMKFPAKSQLRSVSVEVIDRYVEWLLGPNVWGLATMQDGKPVSTPTISHVLAYDLQIRKKQAEFMNGGHDFKSALDAARDPEKEGREIRQVHFLSPVAISINSPECRACTAPGICETFGYGTRGTGASSSTDNGPGAADTLSKKTIKKIKQQAKAEAEREAKRKYAALLNAGGGDNPSRRQRKRANQLANRATLAIQNGGVGDGTVNLTGAFAKGKGKGNKDTHEGVPICYNWNRGAPCKNNPCQFAHVCLICKKKDHPKKDHGAGGA